MNIQFVDICVGLSWGDEGKGKIVSQLSNQYDFVCRWAGGNNAGHTIYVNGKKYATHLIPSGVFHGIPSIIGPGCVVHKESFFEEINYLHKNGFNTKLVKISPKAHIITEEHIEEDKQKYNKVLGTTAKGIGTCYSDKYARKGIRIQDRKEEFKEYIWDEKLFGKVLCEGAQGFWLDIDYGNYPYVTSSSCLPHSACTLGFAPQKIRNIFGAVKMYDTRVGKDPDFPDDLLCNQELMTLAHEGNEYGTTTNRARLVNYLNLDKLISAIEISGTTELIISKVDIVEKANIFRYYYQDILHTVDTLQQMKDNIQEILYSNTSLLKNIIFSSNPEKI
jgi:adenylosuccinate synthase